MCFCKMSIEAYIMGQFFYIYGSEALQNKRNKINVISFVSFPSLGVELEF